MFCLFKEITGWNSLNVMCFTNYQQRKGFVCLHSQPHCRMEWYFLHFYFVCLYETFFDLRSRSANTRSMEKSQGFNSLQTKGSHMCCQFCWRKNTVVGANQLHIQSVEVVTGLWWWGVPRCAEVLGSCKLNLRWSLMQTWRSEQNWSKDQASPTNRVV